MVIRMSEIKLPNSIADHYVASSPFNSLCDIKRLNVFVGPNNSGKSRLLRSMFLASGGLQIVTDHPKAIEAHAAIRGLVTLPYEEDHRFVKYKKVLDGVSIFHGCGQPLLHSRDCIEALSPVVSELSQVAGHSKFKPYFEGFTTLQQAVLALQRDSTPTNGAAPIRPLEKSRFVYVPTLRGMRVAKHSEESKFAYFDRTYTDYIKPFQQKYRQVGELDMIEARLQHKASVATGLEFYDVLTSRLLGDYQDRQNMRRFEEFLAGVFFPGKRLTLIPRQGCDSVYVQIGNERERPIQDVGDGIQQLIILTLPLFENTDSPLFLFVEEPDLFLHPGYQRAFISAVAKNAGDNVYVFVTTHSNQFIDATLDEQSCAIFRCKKIADDKDSENYDPSFEVSRSPFGNRHLLTDIGIRPSSVMFANCTIWVEGVYDRLYIRKLLQIVMDAKNLSFMENLHYAFVQYGGNNIEHWSFLDKEAPDVDRICATLFLIADRDKGKDARHMRLRDSLQHRFHLLGVSEIENLLTPEVITSVIRIYERDSFVDNDVPFNQDDYKDCKLGTFIDERAFRDRLKCRRKSYADESGTVKDKGVFCDRAIAAMTTMEHVSPSAAELVEKLLAFIQSQNE